MHTGNKDVARVHMNANFAQALFAEEVDTLATLKLQYW